MGEFELELEYGVNYRAGWDLLVIYIFVFHSFMLEGFCEFAVRLLREFSHFEFRNFQTPSMPLS